MDCTVQLIAQLRGGKSVPPIYLTLLPQTELIHQTRRHFRGVGERTTEVRTLRVSIPLMPTYHTETLTLARVSARFLDSPDDHGHLVPDHDDPGQETNTPFPYPAQTDVCPQSRPTFAPQTAVVRVTQSCAAIAPAAVIKPLPLEAENAFSEGK